MKGLIGRKIGMTQVFDEGGSAYAVTLIEAGPCFVTQIRRRDRDGYQAVQLGFGEGRSRGLTGGQLGHLKRNDLPPLRYLREFRTRRGEALTEGDRLTVEVFAPGDRVDVVSTSKGRGFQGGMKRHGFGGGPMTHGQSDRQRSPGSRSSTTTPGRVYKGSRGPGHMGSQRVTAANLRVQQVDPERNLIAVAGSVPGPRGAIVVLHEARKQQGGEMRR
jgi:large subunit ribosomal protein L3